MRLPLTWSPSHIERREAKIFLWKTHTGSVRLNLGTHAWLARQYPFSSQSCRHYHKDDWVVFFSLPSLCGWTTHFLVIYRLRSNEKSDTSSSVKVSGEHVIIASAPPLDDWCLDTVIFLKFVKYNCTWFGGELFAYNFRKKLIAYIFNTSLGGLLNILLLCQVPYFCMILFIFIKEYFVVQSEKAVSAYFTSKRYCILLTLQVSGYCLLTLLKSTPVISIIP